MAEPACLRSSNFWILPVLDFQGESLLAPGAAAGVFRVRLSAKELAAYRERFPAHLDADAFALT